MKMKLFFTAALFAVLLFFRAGADAYVLLPTPQKTLFEGITFSVNSEKAAISSVTGSHDKRIIRSINQVFSKAAVSAKPLPLAAGMTVIYATKALDAVTKKYCAAMLCSDIKPDKIPSQGYFLGIRKLKEGNLVLIIAKDDYGEFYATKTLKQLYEKNTLPEISLYDWPDFRVRGILEGFYGKPWPEDRRLAMIPWLADYKFNIYLYAPKDDYKLRMGWRISFTEKERQRVIKINELSKENFIKYCWELSPGVSVSFSSEKDMASAYKKMKSIIETGAECISLAFDDVGTQLSPNDTGKFATYWEGQVAFTNALLGRMMKEYPNVMFSFVPNDYWGALAEESESLRYIGKHLDQRIQIGFTGDEIIPATVTPDDITYYQYYIKRKPILGDNYPVSDYVNKAGRLSLGPLRGRDPSLFRYVDAFVANAMPLPESSKPALLTISEYVWNPFNYDPGKAWANAMFVLGGGDKGRDTLLLFAKQSESSLLWKHDALELFETTRALIRGFRKMPDYKFDDYYPAAKALFTRFASIDKDMEAIKNPANEEMLKEFQPWIQKLKDYGDIGLQAVEMLRDKYDGKSVSADSINELEKKWNKCEENKAVMTKMVMNNFMIQSLAALRGQPEPDLKKYKSIME